MSLDLLIADPRGHVLLGLRNNEPARGTLFVPGGIIFKGERLAAAFARTLMAETGLDAVMPDAVHLVLFEHFYELNAFRLAIPARPVIAADDQHRHIAWMSPEEIRASSQVHSNTRAYFI